MTSDRTSEFSLAAAHEAAAQGLPGADIAWLEAFRTGGIESFRASGLPNRRVEAWRYTNLNALAKLSLAPAGADAVLDALPEGVALAIPGACRIVFVNGRLRAELSDLDDLPAGVVVSGVCELMQQTPAALQEIIDAAPKAREGALAALNDAWLEDGLVLRIKDGMQVDRPIHLVSVGVPQAGQAIAFHPRNLIDAGKDSVATLVESHVGLGEGSYFSNGLTDVTVGKGAALTHAKLQDEGASAFHVALTRVRLADEALYDSFVLQRGAELARNEIHASIDGSGADCRLNGAYLGADRQHIDNTTVIDHRLPGSQSSEVYKGVLAGHARGVFQGRIVVHRDAQQSNGNQLNKTLLLSRDAEMDTKPELEIYADDVKCSHGATVGELSEMELFYLRTRGIDEPTARNMLVSAFLTEAISELRDPVLAEAFAERTTGWVEGRREDEREKAA